MLRAGVVGAQFAGTLHAESLLATGRAEVAAVVAPSESSRVSFAARFACRAYPSVEEMLAAEALDMVCLAMPTRLHAEATIRAAAAGVHVICEKPLAMNLAEADAMITACHDAGVHLLYAEQLCFAPRYRKVKELIDTGALGDVIQINHWERHGGPHAAWFHDPAASGGGVTLDMGCHGVELARWLLGRPAVTSVHARIGIFTHRDGEVDDHSLMTLAFAGGALAVIDSSWAQPGGIDERLEVLGTKGVLKADLMAAYRSAVDRAEVPLPYTSTDATPITPWLAAGREN